MAGAFASAFSAALSAGTTLGATSLGNLLNGVNYSVKCGIEIENWTKWTLDEPSTYMNRGYVSTPAKTILPGSKEAVVTHKAGGTATGTSGTVAWNLGDTGKKVIVMWSAPFNHDHYSNWLAVDVQAEHTKYDFDRMYKGNRRNGWEGIMSPYFTCIYKWLFWVLIP